MIQITKAIPMACILALGASAQAQEAEPAAGPEATTTDATMDGNAQMAGRTPPSRDYNDSQDVRSARNSIWVEGLGNALLYSINYERMVIDDLGVRVGLSYLSFEAAAGDSSASAKFYMFPFAVSYLGVASENKTHALELAAGATLIHASAASDGVGISTKGSGVAGYGTFSIGYRIQPAKGGFQFRVGTLGIFGPGLGFSSKDPGKWGVIPWPYLSLGGTF